MTTTGKWLYPQQILYVEITGILTLGEIIEGHRIHIDMMDSMPHQKDVHFIFDTTDMKKGPTNFLEIRRAGREFYRHPKLGWCVGLGEPPLVRLVSTTISRLLGLRYKSMTEFNEALAFFQSLAPAFASVSAADLVHQDVLYEIGSEVAT